MKLLVGQGQDGKGWQSKNWLESAYPARGDFYRTKINRKK